MVKDFASAVEGVPEKVPLEKVIPAGNEPELIAQVYPTPVPPVAETEAE
jgi:hypothetical protein